MFLACVASVSNRVIARKLEREQKQTNKQTNKQTQSPPPSPSFPFFYLLSCQLSRRTREETLDTQAIMFYDVFQMGIVCWTPAIVDL